MCSKLNLKPEEELILICARTSLNDENRIRINKLINRGINWDYLLKKSSIHKVKSLIYIQLSKTCFKLVPESVMNELKEHYNKNARINLFLTAELIKILKELNSNDICVITYKGPSLALIAYKDLTLREFVDVDLLINRGDMKEIRKLMKKFDYELITIPDNFDEDLYFKTQTEHKFINPITNTIFEFHNRVQGHFFHFPVNPAFLYEDFRYVEINNYQLKTFTNENLLLLLCVHCARHNWSRISWICDIHELVQNNEINWYKVLENSEKLKVKRILLITLMLTENLFQTELPKEVLNLFEENEKVEKISKYLYNKIFNEDNISFSILERLSLDMRKRESVIINFVDVFNSIFRPSYEDYSKFKLPSTFYYVYYFIRPALLFLRYKNIK